MTYLIVDVFNCNLKVGVTVTVDVLSSSLLDIVTMLTKTTAAVCSHEV